MLRQKQKIHRRRHGIHTRTFHRYNNYMHLDWFSYSFLRVWNQKFENKFEASAMVFVDGSFVETSQEDATLLRDYYYGNNSNIEYTVQLNVTDGS